MNARRRDVLNRILTNNGVLQMFLLCKGTKMKSCAMSLSYLPLESSNKVDETT